MFNAKDQPVLYSFRRCPYAMRARMGILSSGIKMEWREVVLRDKPQHMIEISPKATVPVVQLPDGSVIDESLDIMLWALGEHDPENWLPQNPQEQEEADRLIEVCDQSFKHHLDRYKYPDRYEGADAFSHREAALGCLQQWDRALANKAYLTGERLGLADIAIFPFVRQFANVDRPWFDALNLPHLQQWLSARLNSETFTTIMEKRPPWTPEQTITIFPPAP